MSRFRYPMPPRREKPLKASHTKGAPIITQGMLADADPDVVATLTSATGGSDDLTAMAAQLEEYAAFLRQAAPAYAPDAPHDASFVSYRATLLLGGYTISQALAAFAKKV